MSRDEGTVPLHMHGGKGYVEIEHYHALAAELAEVKGWPLNRMVTNLTLENARLRGTLERIGDMTHHVAWTNERIVHEIKLAANAALRGEGDSINQRSEK
jgi:hypothetical protein